MTWDGLGLKGEKVGVERGIGGMETPICWARVGEKGEKTGHKPGHAEKPDMARTYAESGPREDRTSMLCHFGRGGPNGT